MLSWVAYSKTVMKTAGVLRSRLSSINKRTYWHVLTLVLASDSILWHVGVDDGPRLEKQLPQ